MLFEKVDAQIRFIMESDSIKLRIESIDDLIAAIRSPSFLNRYKDVYNKSELIDIRERLKEILDAYNDEVESITSYVIKNVKNIIPFRPNVTMKELMTFSSLYSNRSTRSKVLLQWEVSSNAASIIDEYINIGISEIKNVERSDIEDANYVLDEWKMAHLS